MLESRESRTATAAAPPAAHRALEYRPEVDGLRAISVVAILLFHLELSFVPGGFIGVDCFFVISGYLITRNLRVDIETGTFRFRDFYYGRLRRLFPALAVMLLGVLAAGALFLSPQHYAELARSSIFALFSLTNLLFYADVGYFDLGVEFKPLLHTWSLAVEEQFYLIWPAFLLLSDRYLSSERARRLAIVVLGLASLAASEWILQSDPSAAFYLTPFRLIEFSIGALCVDLDRVRPPWLIGELLVACGLWAIFWSATTFTGETVFPGVNSLAPCLGTAAAIWGARGGLLTKALSLRPIVWIGLLSYSIYLVHWPLIILYKYQGAGALGIANRIGLVVGTMVLAVVLRHFVENPFRRFGTEAASRFVPPVGRTSAVAALAILAVAYGIWRGEGLPNRIDRSMQTAAASLAREAKRREVFSERQMTRPFPLPQKRNGVILGDSHASDLFSALVLGGSKVNFLHLAVHHECQFTLEKHGWGEGTKITSPEDAAACDETTAYLRVSPDLAAADMILLASTWSEIGLRGLPGFVAMLQENFDAKIFLIGPRYFFTDPGRLIARSSSVEEANLRFDAAKNNEEIDIVFERLAKIADDADIEMIDVRPVVCPNTDDVACPLFDLDGNILYWDWHHWTFHAAAVFGSRIATIPRARELF